MVWEEMVALEEFPAHAPTPRAQLSVPLALSNAPFTTIADIHRPVQLPAASAHYFPCWLRKRQGAAGHMTLPA